MVAAILDESRAGIYRDDVLTATEKVPSTGEFDPGKLLQDPHYIIEYILDDIVNLVLNTLYSGSQGKGHQCEQ
jgi:hypothetical protein